MKKVKNILKNIGLISGGAVGIVVSSIGLAIYLGAALTIGDVVLKVTARTIKNIVKAVVK